MAAGDSLTLAAFGVDLDALARRLTDRQGELRRDDVACAALAGVTVERWRAWKEGHERPGVGRVAKLAAALDTVPAWVLYGVTVSGEQQTASAVEPSTIDARRVLDILNRLAPAVEIVESLAEEIARLKLPVPGGARMGISMSAAGEQLRAFDAVTLSAPKA